MSNNIFSNAVKDANLSVKVNNDGIRYVGRNTAMDREPTYSNRNYNNYNNRGRGGRGNSGGGGRWQRGGGFRGNRAGFRGNRGGRGRGRGGRAEDEEGDFVMNENRNSYGAYPRGGSRDGRRERSPEISSQRTSSGWWKVTVIDGRKHNRDWLLRRIKDLCRLPFREANFRAEGSNAVFFITDESVAGALEDTSNRITTKDGSKIIIQVAFSDNAQQSNNSNTSQNVALDEGKLQQLKGCLGQRYEPSSLKLDLSKLLHDPLLKNASILGNVADPPFMNMVLDLIHSFCPNLKILDLSNNRILKLDNLTHLPEKCPELDELDLSGNDIRFTGELTKIKEHKKITKLWFKGNPAQRQFSSNNSAYLTDVQKRLPNLTMLDGVELPAIIKFELEPENESHIPDRKDAYAANHNDLELVKVFVQNFFQCYDHDDASDRQKLLDAYHNEAAFSMCCNSSLQTSTKSDSLNTYIKSSRNLKNIKDKQKKTSLLIHKKLNIVAFLNELPQTKHWLDSFSLDLTLTTLHMLCFTVQGIFLEGKDEIPRGFSRIFIGQRESNTMFLVVNDQLHIRNLTDKQVQLLENAKYNNVPTPLAVTYNIPAPAEVAQTVYTEMQQELATKFSLESKMNLKFSIMCLEAAKWDYQQAAMKFLELHKKGGIPDDAFVQI